MLPTESTRYLTNGNEKLVEMTKIFLKYHKENPTRNLVNVFQNVLLYIKEVKPTIISSQHQYLHLSDLDFLKQYAKWLNDRCGGEIDEEIKDLNAKLQIELKQNIGKIEFVADVAQVFDWNTASEGYPLMYLDHSHRKAEPIQYLIARSLPLPWINTHYRDYEGLKTGAKRIKITIEYTDEPINTDELVMPIENYTQKQILKLEGELAEGEYINIVDPNYEMDRLKAKKEKKEKTKSKDEPTIKRIKITLNADSFDKVKKFVKKSGNDKHKKKIDNMDYAIRLLKESLKGNPEMKYLLNLAKEIHNN